HTCTHTHTQSCYIYSSEPHCGDFVSLLLVASTGDQTSCQDDVDMTWHPLGSHWRNSKCMDCDCSSCCAAYSTPTQFPSDCVAVFDPTACEYIVHKKNDPSEICPVFAAVG
uniref:Beta-microseminoprotein n=1 Tax=Nothobranchius furzeri TaxID=105023 RepID=A0A8C6L640_NOTFU